MITGVPQVLNVTSSVQLTKLGLELILTCTFTHGCSSSKCFMTFLVCFHVSPNFS